MKKMPQTLRQTHITAAVSRQAAGHAPFGLPLANRYGGRAPRRVRHQPWPIKRQQRGSQPGNVREGLPLDEQLPFPPLNLRNPVGEYGARSSASCMKGGIFERGWLVIPLVGVKRSPRDCCVNGPIGPDSAEWGCSRGMFKHAARHNPDSSGGVRGDEACGKAGREHKRDMESYDTVNGSKSFPHGARLDGYCIRTSSIRDGLVDYERVWGIIVATVRRQRQRAPTSEGKRP
jgi:hypothetical protein